MQLKKYIFYFLLLFFVFLHENLKAQSYEDLRKKYFNIEENNEAALGSVNDFIKKAKKKKTMNSWCLDMKMEFIILHQVKRN